MDDQLVVSFSELDTIRQCGFKHNLAYRQRWTTTKTAPALLRGTAWHTVMEDHYGAGIKEAWANLAKVEDDELREQLEWMYSGYVEHWGADTGWTVVSTEDKLTVRLPDPKSDPPDGTWPEIWIKMRLDLAVRWKGQLWVVDHKSARNLPKEAELDIDDQFGLYAWGYQEATGEPVFGLIHNGAKTYKTKKEQELDERFHRTLLVRTPVELATIAEEAYLTAYSAYFSPLPPVRSPNSDTCRWRCSFTDACLTSRKGIEDVETYLELTGFTQNWERH